MDEEDIPVSHRYEYTKTCDICTLNITVFTQDGGYEEYSMNIYCKCTCGNLVHFILPVN